MEKKQNKKYRLTKKQRQYIKIKYNADRILAAGGILVLSPVFAAITLAIKMEDGWKAPVFFKQKRVGLHKSHFMLYKYRSMKLDTPHDVPTHLLENPEQYITKVGRFLRKSSLDELPQLLNILKGEISICGPRPALWNQYDLIEERDKYGVHEIKPGLTGWAQINGRDELEIPVKAKLDGEYKAKIGLKMDMKCFFGTFGSVLKSEGVVEGGTGAMKQAGKECEAAPKQRAEKECEVDPKQQAESECAATLEHSESSKNPKKKILIITNHSYMLYRFRKELIEELQKNNKVYISMPFVGHEDDFKAMGVHCIETPIDRRGINPITDLSLIKTYNRMLNKLQPNLVITYSIKPNIYAGFLCGLKKIPYYANVQGLGTAFQRKGLAQFVTLLYKLAFRKVEKVFFENTGNAREFQIRKIIPEFKQKILSGAGINLTTYSYKTYPDNDKIHFLYLGRIMKEKGMDELFQVVQRLKEEGEDFVLDLVGFYEDEYKDQVEELEDKGIVKFHGFQEEPRPFYEAADCVVLPSYHEGMSNVNLEAAATGRPIITSNIPGCREALDHKQTGLLCRVKDAESLYKAMKYFLSCSKEKREKMGRLGREKMEREFAKEKVVAETVETLGM